jgi:hypothetical protein
MDCKMSETSQAENLVLPVADQTEDSSYRGHACCSMGGCQVRRMIWSMTALAVILGTLTIGYLIGISRTRVSQEAGQSNAWKIPVTADATAAVSSDKYSIATGPVGDEAEGFFVLDHNSGLLQCSVIYPRMGQGQFLGLFTANVNDTLGAGAKGGTYLMVTGQAEFPRASNRAIGANTLVYVLNTATGNYAAYAIPFDRTKNTAGIAQQGLLIPWGTGQANPVIKRDDTP